MNKDQIEDGLLQAVSNDYNLRQIIRGRDYSEGFKKGAEWMEEQLEPIITEYGMEQIKIKAEIKELREALEKIATPYVTGVYGENKAYSITPFAIKIAEQALKPKES